MAFYSAVLSAIGLKVKGKFRNSGARSLVPFSDTYVREHFLTFGYAVVFDQLVFTTESVADYIKARENSWHRPGDIARIEMPGLLIVENAQPTLRQPTPDIVVVSLGDARVVMGVINREGRMRFAQTM